jgi:hypothetical protein
MVTPAGCGPCRSQCCWRGVPAGRPRPDGERGARRAGAGKLRGARISSSLPQLERRSRTHLEVDEKRVSLHLSQRLVERNDLHGALRWCCLQQHLAEGDRGRIRRTPGKHRLEDRGKLVERGQASTEEGESPDVSEQADRVRDWATTHGETVRPPKRSVPVQTRTISEKGLPKRPYDRLRMAATGLDRRRREVDDCAGRKRLLTAGEARRRQVSLMRGDA